MSWRLIASLRGGRLPACGRSSALTVLLFAGAAAPLAAREDTRSYFQFATPIEMPAAATTQLAELQLTPSIYHSVRRDFADFRIVQSSNKGAVPVIISKKVLGPANSSVLVERDFTVLADVSSDLQTRYADSRIIAIQTGRMPLTQVGIRADTAYGYQVMVLGRAELNATGAEWTLLVRSGLSADSEDVVRELRVNLEIPESCWPVYAFVVDSTAPEGSFAVDSVRGPEYCAYFLALPGESYTLLTGYPDASPLVGFNSVEITRMQAKGVTLVPAHASPLLANPEWRSRSLRERAKDNLFLLPVAIVALLIAALLVFMVSYGCVNRQKALTLPQRPRFHK